MSGRGRPPTGRPYEHACRVWAAMAERSVPLTEASPEVQALADPSAVTPDSRVFVGGLVALFEEVGLRSRAQYHTTKNHLVAVGALVRLRRGTGRVDAVWLLGPEPTIERWSRHIERPGDLRRLLAVEREHHFRLAQFLRDMPTVAPTLAEELRMRGARTVADVLDYMGQLPAARLAGLGPAACLRFAGRVEHTCGLERVGPQPVQPHPPARLVR